MDRSRLKLIGIGGTNGSGKDTLGHILASYYGYLFITVTDLLRDECHKRGLSVERVNLRKISAEWRADHGLGVLVDKAIEAYKEVAGQYRGLAAASLRNPGEADRIHELGGLVIWLDADPKIRYERITSGAGRFRSNRTSEDNKTFEQFMQEEKDEMYSSGQEKNALNMLAVKEKADVFITNDKDQAYLREQIEKALGL